MPDAPPPVRNSLGDIVGTWECRVRYDEVLDEIQVHWTSPGGPWRKAQRLRLTYGPDEVEEAIGQVSRLVRTAGARRLF